MLRFTTSIDGVETLNRAFNRLESTISDFRAIWPEVAKEFYAIEREQFDSEGAAGASGKWEPLSPAYKQWKEVHHFGQGILAQSGDLEASLTDPEAKDAVYRPEKEELIIGTRVPYGVWHQRGTGRMPARPPISLSEQQKRRLQKAIQRGLVQFTRQAGFQVEGSAT